MPKKIIFVIVEGPSDDDSLGIFFDKYYDNYNVEVKVMHCDITTKKGVTITNILSKVADVVKEYAEKVIALYPDNEKLMNLIADMLKYGAAAQKYVEYKKDELVTDDMDLDNTGSTADPTADDNNRSMTTAEGTGIDKSVYSFAAAGVRFDFDNKIYVKPTHNEF